MADTNRDDRGMETGSRERSRVETQGDGDKRSLADDELRSASEGHTGSSRTGLEAASGSARAGSERMGNEGGGSERSGSNSSRGAQELPLDEVHKINHGDKYDAMIPRGTDEHAGDRPAGGSSDAAGEGERR